MQQSPNGMTLKGYGDGQRPWLGFEEKARSRQYFRICTLNSLPVVSTPAEIDVDNSRQLTRLIVEASDDAPAVIVDMTATSYIDAACVGALVCAYLRLEEQSIELRVATSNAKTRWLLAEFGQDRLFRVFDTLPEAVTTRPKRWAFVRQAA